MYERRYSLGVFGYFLLRKRSDMDEVIKHYSEELERIYNERTAGDHTFTGIVARFLFDLAADPEFIQMMEERRLR